jgi:WhiB family redox-sensing transcriptional regulator
MTSGIETTHIAGADTRPSYEVLKAAWEARHGVTRLVEAADTSLDVRAITDPVNDDRWVKAGLCDQVMLDTHYPERGGSNGASKRVCAPCPVKLQCLLYALEAGENFGTWGETTERERQPIMRNPGRRNAMIVDLRRKITTQATQLSA